MTNLEALRLLEAEQMAEFLTNQRMIAPNAIAEKLHMAPEELEELESNLQAMFLKWLLREATL